MANNKNTADGFADFVIAYPSGCTEGGSRFELEAQDLSSHHVETLLGWHWLTSARTSSQLLLAEFEKLSHHRGWPAPNRNL